MQSDLFDKKVREAADHHHPAYHEDAWKRMKKLLDEHMPEEDDRRKRYFFLIPLFLLLTGGIWLMTSQPWKTKNSSTAETKNTTGVQNVVPGQSGVPNEQPSPAVPGTGEDDTHNEADENTLVNTDKDETSISSSISLTPRHQLRKNDRPAVITKVTKTLAKTEEAGTVDNLPGQDPNPVTAVNENQTGETEKVTVAPTKEEAKPVASAGKDEPQPETKTKNEEQKKPNKKPVTLASRLFFFVSTGPDISFTSSSEMGKTRMILGAGAGFKLNERFTIRSGFFSARKVYSAKPSDYDPPPQFWNYYPNMQKIDADCKVYEVPLLLSYRFGKRQTKSWFATAGVSSYFMKKEKYTYYYKPTPTSATYKRDYTINNRFEHHFSVITLSAGYQRNLGKRVTLMAEPYFKLPVTGIGFGKVKLNSGGVMLSIGVRPFGK